MQVRIEELQADQVRRLLGPVVGELAGLHADLAEAARLDYERLGLARVPREFSFLADRIERALELLDVVSVDAQPGQTFDSRLHAAGRRVLTGDRSLDGSIAAVQRQGFRFAHEAKTSLYARVTVYGYDASLDVNQAVGEPAPIDEAVQVPPTPDEVLDLSGSLDPSPEIPRPAQSSS